MAMDFRRFLQEMVGGNTPQVPAFQQQQSPPPLPPQNTPLVGPLPTPAYQAPAPVQITPAPVVAPQPPPQAMSPAQFAAQQGPVQGPTPPPAEPDMSGTWVTVQYQYNGVNYMLLMPEESAQNLPPEAQLVANGEVTDPNDVAKAYAAGERGQTGQGFIGALDQAPPEVQAVFRSQSDQATINQGNQGMRTEQVQQNQQAIEDMGFGPIVPTTQVPTTNLQGQTPEQVQQDQQSFDQLMQTVGTQGVDKTVAELNAGPPLTTETLRASDNPDLVTKGSLLEQNGIFEVPANRMVVQYDNGRMSVVPQSETPPPNATIIIYGGDTPTPGNRGIGGLGEMFGDALQALEIPQRITQDVFTDTYNSLPPFLQDVVSNIGQGTPLAISAALLSSDGPIAQTFGALMRGESPVSAMASIFQPGTYEESMYGLPAFAQWMEENPDAAKAAYEGGYNGFEGNRAVWERFQADRNLIERTLDSFFSDPLNAATSAGAPARGAARAVGNVRRGMGYTDEVVDVLNASDTAVAPVTRRTAQEVVTTPAIAIDDTATTAAEQAARNNPITGQGIIPEVVDVVPGQTVTPVVANAPRSGQVVDTVLGATEDILNLAADILDIPENALGALVDRGIITIRGLVDTIGSIPAPDGRTIGDLWNRTTDQSVLRNTEEEISTVFDDTMGIERREPPTPDVPPAVAADAVPTPTAPRAPEFPTTPISTPEPPLPVERRGVGQQPLLAADRPIDDLGTPPPPVAAADAALPTDRPVDDLTPRTPEELAIQRDEQFLATPEGQRTQKIMQKWNKEYADIPFIKPQTGMQRNAGVGRLNEAFELRPMDAARELAADHPQKYEAFVRDMDRALSRAGSFAKKEKQRIDTPQLPHMQSTRFPTQRESGTDLRSTWEVLNEAEHLARVEIPLFNRHFGDVAEVPEYQWKRWGRAGESHTALDTLAQNGGRVDGMPLHEVTEVAIFHPDESTRLFALDNVRERLSIRDDAGHAIKTMAGDNLLRKELRDGPLGEIISRGKSKRRSIQNLRDTYQRAVDANRSMQRPLPEPQQAVDAPANSDVTDLTSDGSIGGQVADLTEVATAIDDIAMESRNVPLSLPYRATSQIEATPMPGPRGTDTAPVGGQPVPPSHIQRRADRISSKIESVQRRNIQELADYRASAQRNMETDPLTRGERRAQSRRDYLASRAEGRADAMRNTSTPVSRMDLQSFYVRGRAVSASQAEVFGRKFSDGESLAARWDRYTLEEMDKLGPDADLQMAEGLAASRTINDYVVEIMPDDIRARYDQLLKKARSQKIEGDEGQMVNRSELMAQNHALEQIRRQSRTGKAAGFWRRYDRVMTAIRQTFLYNWLTGPRYVVTQFLGNSTTATLTGHSDILGQIVGPDAIRRAWKASADEGVLPNSVMDEVLTGYGGSGRRNLTRGDSSVRDQTIEQAITDKNKYSLLGRYTRPIADRRVRDFAAAGDRLPREAMWASIMDTNLSVARRNLWEQMEATLPADASYAQARKLFDDLPQRFSSDDFRDTFVDFDANWVDRNARDWQEAFVKTDKAAKAEVKRTFFDGTEKNIDTYLKRVLFFHYWMSRATPLYTEAIARDPVYLYNFMKLQEAMRDDSDGSGANFMKFFSTPMGYNILIRPDAMLATFTSFWEDAGFTPEGESKLGKWLRNSPVMVNPLVQSALNLTGYMGDTFGPDPVGANKFIQFAQAAIDNANAQFGWGLPPVGNQQESTMRQIRDWVSGITGDFLPGAEHIEFSDPMAYKDNEVRSIVAEIALERGMSLEDPIVQDAMANPESELYQEAMKQYAMQDAMDIALRIIPVTAVLYPKSQLAGPKDRSAGIEQEKEQSARMGIGLQEDGDQSAATPRGEQLYNERNIIAASTEQSRNMQNLQDQYSAIGSPEEQAAYRFYNGIRYGDTDATIVVGGRSYNPDQIQSLYAADPAQAESLADQWAEETGNADRVASMSEQRKAFRDEHPEYQEFVSWSGQIRDYEGGPQGWWQDVAQGNPNAARWFNSLTDEQKQDDMILTSMDGYFAYRGDQLAYWDQTPIETNTPVPPEPYNPIGSLDGGTEGGSSSERSYGPTKEAIDEQIVEYQAELEAYNETVRTVLNQPPGFRLDLVNPVAQQAIEGNLRQAGIEPPRMGGYLYDYLQWAEANQGGDTSVNAYLRWYETQNPPAVEEKPAA